MYFVFLTGLGLGSGLGLGLVLGLGLGFGVSLKKLLHELGNLYSRPW